MGTLRITLLGEARLSLDGENLPEFPTRKARNLFFYLALKRGRLHPRDVLVGTFWGDVPEPLARKRFRTTLWRVRSTLGSAGAGSCIVRRGREIGFDGETDHWLDVQAFERALDAARNAERRGDRTEAGSRLDEALTLYGGDLLEGVYHDWCVREQQTLKARFLNALETKMCFAVEEGDWRMAIDVGRELLGYDPLREHIHRDLIESLYQVGDRPAALNHYRRLEVLLRSELDVDPMIETRRLVEAIRRERVPARATPAGRAPRYGSGGYERAPDRSATGMR